MRQALIIRGGWEGHEPVQTADLFASLLRTEGFAVEISDTLDSLLDLERLASLDLLIPQWTMGAISATQSKNATAAIAGGVGLAGCHGGMCDAFRENTEWQFMCGGNWVAHPGNDNTSYTVEIVDHSHEITRDLPDFEVRSEQYYLHVDPGVHVLATTPFPNPAVPGPHQENACAMPVVWTKKWGLGRVFYCSLGHHADVFEIPEARELMRRGFLWAAAGKAGAR